MSEHQNLLKKAMFVLSSRVKLSSKSQPGFQELLKYVYLIKCDQQCNSNIDSSSPYYNTYSSICRQAFHYLEQFSSSVPNIMTAVSLTKLLAVLSEKGRDSDNSMSTALGKFHTCMCNIAKGFQLS